MLKYHIQTIEVGSGGAASITFSSIPATYTDLYLVFSLRNSVDTAAGTITFNTSGGTYTRRRLQGNGSGVLSDTAAFDFICGPLSFTASTFGNSTIYIPNYRSSAAKSYSSDSVSENNATTSYQTLIAGLWSETDAITTITLTPGSGGNWVQYSSATLYGIKHGTSGEVEVASGGTISYSGGYTIHTFNSSGTLVLNQDVEAEYLVIAGGGCGSYGGQGYNGGGGGGAGGYRCSVSGESSGGGASAESPLQLSRGVSYQVLVGAGGAAATSEGAAGSSGSNSIFANIISIGGGKGGGNYDSSYNGQFGGSGGASAAYQRPGGLGTANQGFDGGDGADSEGGGGGGAGGAGENARPGGVTRAGDGGIALASSITGSSIARAGGGGGGTYNVGRSGYGGGGGATDGGSNPADATANTGSGGGGQKGYQSFVGGGNGGSGVVIIRYLTP